MMMMMMIDDINYFTAVGEEGATLLSNVRVRVDMDTDCMCKRRDNDMTIVTITYIVTI